MIYHQLALLLAGLLTVGGIAPAFADANDDKCSGLTNDPVNIRIQACTAAIAADPAGSDAMEVAYGNRAHLFDRSGDPKKAIVDATQALAIDPNAANEFVDRCDYLTQTRKYQSAISDCDSAIKIIDDGKSTAGENDNIKALAYANRGLAHLGMKQRPQATADFHTALTFQADDETLANIRSAMQKNGIAP